MDSINNPPEEGVENVERTNNRERHMPPLGRVKEENSGFVQLLKLIIYVIAGLLAFSILALVLAYALYGKDGLNLAGGLNTESKGSMQIFMIATSLGMFLAPALYLAYAENGRVDRFYGFKKPNAQWLLLVVAIMAVSMPLMEWTAAINQKMVLPDFLKGLETWMKEKEDAAMETTLFLLKMNTVTDLLINIFMIAIIPAIAEELMFRGAIQRSFGKIFNNPHVAIWVTAFIFSAIHVQFYGFLPRFLLGAGFGYLYFWSGSLWYAILGHFLNNAYAVCAAWYMQKNNIPLSESEEMHFAWYGYLISFILTILAFAIFKQQTKRSDEQQLD